MHPLLLEVLLPVAKVGEYRTSAIDVVAWVLLLNSLDGPSTSRRPSRQRGSDSCSIVAAVATSEGGSGWIFLARMPLPSFLRDDDDDDDDDDIRRPSFSILSWNILLPNSRDNWWCHKQYTSNVDMSKRTWSHRRGLIRERIAAAEADVVCIQEVDSTTTSTSCWAWGTITSCTKSSSSGVPPYRGRSSSWTGRRTRIGRWSLRWSGGAGGGGGARGVLPTTR